MLSSCLCSLVFQASLGVSVLMCAFVYLFVWLILHVKCFGGQICRIVRNAITAPLFSGFDSPSLPGWPDLGSVLSRRWPRQPANFYFVLQVSRDTLLFFGYYSQISSSTWTLRKTSLNSFSMHHRLSDPLRVHIHLLGMTGLEGPWVRGIRGHWPQGTWGATQSP